MPLVPVAGGGGGGGPGGAGAGGPGGAAAGGSGYELGSRERRWTLYHQVGVRMCVCVCVCVRARAANVYAVWVCVRARAGDMCVCVCMSVRVRVERERSVVFNSGRINLHAPGSSPALPPPPSMPPLHGIRPSPLHALLHWARFTLGWYYTPPLPLPCRLSNPSPPPPPPPGAGGGRAPRPPTPQVTLLERAIRRTAPLESAKPAGASASGGPGATPSLLSPSTSFSATSAAAAASASSSASPPPDHPFSPHLEWCLPPVARMIACVHALADARLRPLLGPLALVNELDPLERASRLGEDRDAVKAQEQAEPR